MDYNFLQDLSLVDKSRRRAPKSNIPTGMKLRILSNGSVFPSEELTKEFNLEYLNKDSTTKSYGFDIVDSRNWNPTAKLPKMILIGAVLKTEPKIDLFGTCRYNDNNTPKSSVASQGSKSQELLNLVKEFGWLTDEQTYCDLTVRLEHPVKTEDGLAYVPKTITRGEHAGEMSYERRENVIFYPIDGEEEKTTVKQENESPSEDEGEIVYTEEKSN